MGNHQTKPGAKNDPRPAVAKPRPAVPAPVAAKAPPPAVASAGAARAAEASASPDRGPSPDLGPSPDQSRMTRILLGNLDNNNDEEFLRNVKSHGVIAPRVVIGIFEWTREWAIRIVNEEQVSVSPPLSASDKTDIALRAYYEPGLPFFDFAKRLGATDVNMKKSPLEGPPLSFAITFAEEDKVRWLLDNGARWNYEYPQGRRAQSTIGVDLDDDPFDDGEVKLLIQDHVRGVLQASRRTTVGEGNNSEVYAYDTVPGVVNKAAVEEEEAEITKKLSGYPGLPVLYLGLPSADEEGSFDLIMKDVTPWRGFSDVQSLHDGAQVTRRMVMYLISKIMDAYVQAREIEPGFVHGDLKPDNVMLTGDGDDNPEVVMIDFGSAADRDSSLGADFAKLMAYLPRWRELLKEGDLHPVLTRRRTREEWLDQLDQIKEELRDVDHRNLVPQFVE